MTVIRLVQHCRWSEPTLFLPMPFWLDAWEYPWSCLVEGRPKPLHETDRCQACGRWTLREMWPARDAGLETPSPES